MVSFIFFTTFYLIYCYVIHSAGFFSNQFKFWNGCCNYFSIFFSLTLIFWIQLISWPRSIEFLIIHIYFLYTVRVKKKVLCVPK
jgi:hypothetical protein